MKDTTPMYEVDGVAIGRNGRDGSVTLTFDPENTTRVFITRELLEELFTELNTYRKLSYQQGVLINE